MKVVSCLLALALMAFIAYQVYCIIKDIKRKKARKKAKEKAEVEAKEHADENKA